MVLESTPRPINAFQIGHWRPPANLWRMYTGISIRDISVNKLITCSTIEGGSKKVVTETILQVRMSDSRNYFQISLSH